MGRFFFHIRDQGAVVDDPEGQECATVAAARALAITGLRDLIASDVREGRLNTGLGIAIADEAGREVDAVTFDDAVAITGQHPVG